VTALQKGRVIIRQAGSTPLDDDICRSEEHIQDALSTLFSVDFVKPLLEKFLDPWIWMD
jgi:hypothetical protein